MNIYILKNGQQLGPFNETEVRDKMNAGQFTPNDWGWYEGLTNWQPLSTLMAKLSQSNIDTPPYRFALATISFIFAMITAALWIFLDVLFVATRGFRNIREFDGLIIFLVIACIAINIAGLVFGIIGTAKNISNKWMAIVGMAVNTLGFFAMLVLFSD